jgi:hypothetical protein
MNGIYPFISSILISTANSSGELAIVKRVLRQKHSDSQRRGLRVKLTLFDPGHLLRLHRTIASGVQSDSSDVMHET